MDIARISISGDMMEHLMGALLLSLGGAIIDASDGALDLYGFTPAEIRDLSLSDLEADASNEAHVECLRAAASSWNVFRTEHRRKDGTEFWVEIMSVPVRFCGEDTVLSVVRDITELRRVEAALSHSRTQMQAILDDTVDVRPENAVDPLALAVRGNAQRPGVVTQPVR